MLKIGDVLYLVGLHLNVVSLPIVEPVEAGHSRVYRAVLAIPKRAAGL